MDTSLIITTYNRPDALTLVVRSAFSQSILPNEIIIADDGSTEHTRSVIEELQKLTQVPLHHIWQEDKGFRAARVRNLAAAAARGEYLIFIDGDMILHPRFVESHLSAVKAGFMLHGKRAMLSSRRTARVLRDRSIFISLFLPGITLRSYAVDIPLLSGKSSYESTNWYDTQSANLSMWKRDLVAVNGFNEDFEGWGREDSELALRLMRNGIKKLELRFCAVTFHLAHGKDNKLKSPESTTRNQLLLEQMAASDVVRCQNGIDKHL